MPAGMDRGAPLTTPRGAEMPLAPASGEVVGVPLALTDYERTLDWIDEVVAAGGGGYVCVANTHTVMATHEDQDLRDAVHAADFAVPDGQPLVWALNALGHSVEERVYGPDLMDRACERAARTGRRMYLYGGRDQGALVQLTRNLRIRHAGLRIVGGYAPPFRELTPEEEAEVVDDIKKSGAEVVWVGIGVPKQEKWMARMTNRLPGCVLVGVGAAFDFHGGLIPQAPGWMQRWGLEWLFRLAQEPRRLWRRYLRYNPRFLAAFARQWASQRRARR